MATGSKDIVVAVIDSGIDYTHPDIAANVWSAPRDFSVTIGGVTVHCPAGSHGFNARTKTCDPLDVFSHGTHVAGIIGAAGNNGIGVVGVNWNTLMIGGRFLDDFGVGTTADAIDAIDFMIQTRTIFASTGGANIRVLNNSWGGGAFSQALRDMIELAASHDMLFVAAAGNSGRDDDADAFLSGQLRRAERDRRRGDDQSGRPVAILELRRNQRRPGGPWRMGSVDDPGKRLCVPERHVDGDAARGGSRGADPVRLPVRHGRAQDGSAVDGRRGARPDRIGSHRGQAERGPGDPDVCGALDTRRADGAGRNRRAI